MTTMYYNRLQTLLLAMKITVSQPRSQGLSLGCMGKTLEAAGHVPPRFWEVHARSSILGNG